MAANASRHQVAGQAPVYYECPSCGWLSSHRDFRDVRGAECTTCAGHAEIADARTFPTERLRRLDRRIRRYHLDGEHEITVILASAFLEALLEDIIDRILTAHGADVGVRRVVMEGQRSIGQRLGRVFPHLTGAEFEDAAAELGYRDFPHRWRQLRAARNAFIHDSPFRGTHESLDQHWADEAMTLLDQAYQLFVSLNNRFAATLARETDT
jgi:hypothetical protein